MIPDTAEPILAWHFRDKNGTTHQLQAAEQVGIRYSVTPPVACCKNGLHGSIRAIDALEYASADTVLICRTSHEGEIDRQADKIASEHRTVLWQADCTAVLHEFACLCAEQSFEILKKHGPVPAEFAACVAAKRAWMRGEITSLELEAARGAARGAAWEAAWGAAWQAARGAAWEAARGAAWEAAWGAAWQAARGAAWEAAWEAAWGAAWQAAREAAREAARGAQNILLEEMLNKLNLQVLEVAR